MKRFSYFEWILGWAGWLYVAYMVHGHVIRHFQFWVEGR